MRRLVSFLLVLAPTLVLVTTPSPGAPNAAPDAGLADGAALPRVVDASLDTHAHAHARSAKDSGPISKTPPDPPPLEDRHQVVVELRWEKGEVFLVSVRPLDVESPRVTPRVMGRFALELFEDKTLIERVRFDFPGLIDGDFMDAGHSDPPRIDRKLTTRVGVLFPRIPRGTKFELWDRATDRRWPLPWPPPPTPPGPSGKDAGS